MRTEAIIKTEGMRTLRQAFGLVDAGKFIMLKKREPFDYTEWHTYLWEDRTVSALFKGAQEYEEGR